MKEEEKPEPTGLILIIAMIGSAVFMLFSICGVVEFARMVLDAARAAGW